MPELIERGHIYIAQPPLYKVKHGKIERYLKDEHEQKQYLMTLALSEAELHTSAGGPTLSKEPLEKVANEYLLAEAVIERASRLIDENVLHALLRQPVELDLASEQGAQRSAQALAALLLPLAMKVEARYDEKTERNVLAVSRTQHGVVHQTYIDADFAQSGDYAQIRKTALVLQGLLGAGAYVKRGAEQQPVKEFREAIDWLLGEVQRGISVQRYKGLGEMNPEQLWETTMDPATRRLLKTRVEDAVTAGEIFSTLMGDEVEPRREFIETNALGVRNLDI
jgi:DNA gyrase subunit B